MKDTHEHRLSQLVFVLHSAFNYWNLERILGFGTLILGVLIAVEHQNVRVIEHVLVSEYGFSPVILSHWYVGSGLFLMVRHSKSSNTMLIVTMLPMLFHVITEMLSYFLMGEIIQSTFSFSEKVIVLALIINRMVYRLLKEI